MTKTIIPRRDSRKYKISEKQRVLFPNFAHFSKIIVPGYEVVSI